MENLKKREWIKNAIIIFLVVMLILTLFSNTIMNYSLPEVSAQYTSSGQITNKVRGTGVVETADPYTLEVKEERKISSVKVRVGDTVEIGDVLYELDEAESEELKTKREELKKAEDAYESKIITSEIERKTTAAVANGSIGTLESNQAKLEAAKGRVESLEKRVANLEKAQSQYGHDSESFSTEDLQNELNSWKNQHDKDCEDLAKAKEAYEEAVNKSKDEYLNTLLKECNEKEDAWRAAAAIWAEYDVDDVSGTDINPVSAGIAKKNNDDAESAYFAALDTYTTAKEEAKKYTADYIKKLKETYDYESSNASYSAGMVNYYKDAIKNGTKEVSDKKYSYEKQLVDAREALEEAKEDYSDLNTELGNMYGLDSDMKDIIKKREEVEKLQAESIGNAITAPVAGTILSLKYVAGETAKVGEVATIQRAGKGFTMSLNITKEQAKFVSVGDEADVANSWWYSDIHARVREIRPDQANPNGKIIIFEVEGEDLISGTSLNVSVGNKTANYDIIVPNSALGEDSKGKYVYKVDSKSTPFGNRYIARKVYVTILAESDTESAVSGDLIGWDYVVTTSSKPFEDGQQIRLKD